MDTPQKRAPAYLDPELHRVLRLKAVENDRSVSELVNDAVMASLARDAGDLAALEPRRAAPSDILQDALEDPGSRRKR